MRIPFRRTTNQEGTTMTESNTPDAPTDLRSAPDPVDPTPEDAVRDVPPDQNPEVVREPEQGEEPEPEVDKDPEDPESYDNVRDYNERPSPDDGTAVFRGATHHNPPEES